MSRSKIFDEYAKIALEKGLIKKGEDFSTRESRSKEKKYTELSAIELLYGVKPNKEDDVHIMQQAHPKPVVVSPAHDKMNGLVENNLERQNIIINMVGRENNGALNQRKLAQHELMMELVRVANDLDNKGKNELYALADDCIEKVSLQKEALVAEAGMLQDFRDWVATTTKSESLGNTAKDVGEFGKGAAIGAVVGGVLGGLFGAGFGAVPGAAFGGVVGGGLVAALGKTGVKAVNVSRNSEILISEIDDVIKDFPEAKFLNKFKASVVELKAAADNYASLMQSTGEFTPNAVTAITVAYKDQCQATLKLCNQYILLSESGAYRSDSKMMALFHTIWNDNDNDVVGAINALKEVIQDADKAAQALKEAGKKSIEDANKKAEEDKKNSEEEAKKKSPSPSSSSPASTTTPATKKQEDDDDEILAKSAKAFAKFIKNSKFV